MSNIIFFLVGDTIQPIAPFKYIRSLSTSHHLHCNHPYPKYHQLFSSKQPECRGLLGMFPKAHVISLFYRTHFTPYHLVCTTCSSLTLPHPCCSINMLGAPYHRAFAQPVPTTWKTLPPAICLRSALTAPMP